MAIVRSTEEIVGAFEGARKVTCREASDLLKEGKIIKAWFRPDGFINYQDADNDIAFIWR